MAGWGAKTVRLEAVAQQKADDATEVFDRFEDTFFALQWLLARKPDVGLGKIESPNGERVYVQKSDSIAKTPSIWVLFSDTPHEIIIWDINVVKFSEDTE